MNIYAISDLHLSNNSDKPMNIFGPRWEGHWDIIKNDWMARVNDNDIVLLGGDLSWAMKLEDAIADLDEIAALPGHKVIIRGNHDYWWNSYSKVKKVLQPKMYAIQNDCLRIDNVLIVGSRGWMIADNYSTPVDKKIYDREVLRLRMSLDAMSKIRNNDDIVIGMMHYPPFNNNSSPTEFTDLFKEYHVDKVIYGHIHSAKHNLERELTLENVAYYLTSCDQINNKLAIIK